nr:DUF4215 domain-containing protein [Deltaproteobacteria bacterium]
MASSNESATNVEAHRRAVPAHVPAFVVSLLVTTAGCARGVWPEEGGESDGPFTLGDGSDGELGGGDAPGDDSFNEDCELGGEGCPCIVSDDCAPDLECEDEVCILPGVCGDGVHNGGEECDDGEANADDMACKSDCTLQWCGDGLLGPQEQCDDGNVDGADGCSQCDCRLTFTDAADTGDWTLTGDWAIRSEAPYANGQLPAVPFVSQGLVLGT